MSLGIRKLSTDCLAPPRHAALRWAVDGFARDRFASDLAAHLGPSLDRQPQIIRLRRLTVKMEIPAAKFSEAALSTAWVMAFSRALFQALAYPDGMGPAEVRRYANRPHYLAAALREMSERPGAVSWPYAEFAIRHGTVARAITSLANQEPGTLREVLVSMAASASLDGLLAQVDELVLERVFAALSVAATAGEPRPAELLIAVATAFATVPPARGWTLNSQRQALRVWAVMATARSQVTPRQVRLALRVLKAILQNPIWPVRAHTLTGTDSETVDYLQALAADLANTSESASVLRAGPARERLREAMERMGGVFVPAPIPPKLPQLSVESPAAGVLMLLPVIDRLNWWKSLDEIVPRYARPRTFAYLMAGIAFACGVTKSDAAAALLGGNTGDFDTAGLDRFCETTPVVAFAAAFQLTAEGSTSWREFFEAAARHLASAFALRVRGFREARFDTIRRNFLLRPGRVMVEEQRFAVILEPHAWNVALHISGMDDAVDGIEWLDGRLLEFTLEGL